MQRFSILLLVAVALWSNQSAAQLVWKPVQTPEPVKQFVTSPDGGLYFSSGDWQSSRLYYSSNRGVDWTKAYEGQIALLECDSLGTLFLADSIVRSSHDHGSTWAPFDLQSPWYTGLSHIAFSNQAMYHASPNGSVNRSTDGGASWDTVAVDLKNVADWARLYAGSGDRVIAATTFDGSFRFRVEGIRVSDTENFLTKCPIMDNTPITNAVFAADGYTYIGVQCLLARFDPVQKLWVVYRDSSDFQDGELSLAAIGAAVVAVDREGTYLSADHGDSWTKVGTGLPTDYPPGVRMLFTNTGRGYAWFNDTLYTTDYFAAAPGVVTENQMLVATPSPVHSVLHLQVSGATRASLFSVTGSAVGAPTRVREDGIDINVENLPDGHYTAIVYVRGQSLSAHFVKQ